MCAIVACACVYLIICELPAHNKPTPTNNQCERIFASGSVCTNMSTLPPLERLTLAPTTPKTLQQRWISACGKYRPAFKSWHSLNRHDKHTLLHNIAGSVDGYATAYERRLLVEPVPARTMSVEHVLPRSMINGRGEGAAENDPFGWIVATRSANSSRSNKPLVLWVDDDPPHTEPRAGESPSLVRLSSQGDHAPRVTQGGA